MRNRLLKKLVVASTTVLMLISCGGKNQAKPTKPDEAPGEHDPEAILDDLSFNPEHPIDYTDRAQYHSDHVVGVKPNYTFSLCARDDLELSTSEKQTLFSNSNVLTFVNDVVIKSNKGHKVAFTCEKPSEDATECEIIPANEIYEPGAIYTATLFNNSICFKDKSPEIRKLYFDVEREDSMKYELSKDLSYFNAAKVLKEAKRDTEQYDLPTSEDSPEAKALADWFNDTTYELIFATNEFSKLKEGDMFAICPFKGGKPAMDDKNSYFGKFVKNEKVSGGYKVTYKNVDLNEIYKDEQGNDTLDIHINEREVEEFRDVTLTFDEEAYKDFVRHDRSFNLLVDAAMMASGADKFASKYDVMSAISFAPSFDWNAPKFVFQFKATLNLPLNAAKTIALYVELTYQYTSVMSASASYDVKKFMGIPYWIEARGDLIQTVTNKFAFKIGFMKNFEPQEQDTSDMKKMIKNAYEKLERDPNYLIGEDGLDYSTSKNQKFIPIATLNFPFCGFCSFYIEANIHITVDFKVLFEYTYVNQYTERIVSFTTDDGIENTANKQSESVSCHSVDLLGEFGIELGLQLRIGLCITGLSKLFGLGIAFEGGVYLDLKGMLGMTWGDGQDFRFMGGIDLDFGIYGEISGYIDIAVVHLSYSFVKKRKSLLGYSRPYSIIDLMAPDEIEMTGDTIYIDVENLLTAKVFSVQNMNVGFESFRANQTIETTDGNIKPIDISIDQTKYPYLEIDVDNNKIVLKENHPAEFTAEIKLKTNDAFKNILDDEAPSKTVKVHYKSANAHNVVIKNASNSILIEKGKKITLPQLEHVNGMNDKYSCELSYNPENYNVVSSTFKYDETYYDFLYFTDGTSNYKPGATITAGDKDIVITPILNVITYYTATFWNGKGEIIKVSRVIEFTDAVAPTDEEIMHNMDGYTFYGWDRTFTHLTGNINVYGIYYKLG